MTSQSLSHIWFQALRLIHCGLVTSYDDLDLGQHCRRQQAIIWTNVDLTSVRSSYIHLMEVSKEIPQPSITKISMKIIYLKFHSSLLGANTLEISSNQKQNSSIASQEVILRITFAAD